MIWNPELEQTSTDLGNDLLKATGREDDGVSTIFLGKEEEEEEEEGREEKKKKNKKKKKKKKTKKKKKKKVHQVYGDLWASIIWSFTTRKPKKKHH